MYNILEVKIILIDELIIHRTFNLEATEKKTLFYLDYQYQYYMYVYIYAEEDFCILETML